MLFFWSFGKMLGLKKYWGFVILWNLLGAPLRQLGTVEAKIIKNIYFSTGATWGSIWAHSFCQSFFFNKILILPLADSFPIFSMCCYCIQLPYSLFLTTISFVFLVYFISYCLYYFFISFSFFFKIFSVLKLLFV